MIAEYQAELEAASRTAALASRPDGHGRRDAHRRAQPRPGKAIFEGPDNVCFSCHRADLGGLVGPNLTDDYWLHGCSIGEVMTSIKTGYPLKGMQPFGVGKPLTDQQIQEVASYVLSRRGSNPQNAKPIEPDRDKACR